MTYYDILGISRTAKDSEIKKAYHRMIIAFHPDIYQGDKNFAAEKTHELIEAYNVLRHPAARKEYDELLDSQLHTSVEQPGDDAGRRTHTRYHRAKPNIPSKCKAVFIVIGILFVIFTLVLFFTVISSI